MDASFDVVLDAVPCCFTPTLTERKILSSQLKKLAIPLRTKKAKHKAQGTKQLGVLLLPPGSDASPSQDTQHKVTRSVTTSPWIRC